MRAYFEALVATTNILGDLNGDLVVSELKKLRITKFLTLPLGNTSIGAVIYLVYNILNPYSSSKAIISFLLYILAFE